MKNKHHLSRPLWFKPMYYISESDLKVLQLRLKNAKNKNLKFNYRKAT